MDNGNEMSSSLTFASSSYLSNGSSSQNLSAAATGCSNLDNLSLNKLSTNPEKLLFDSEYEYSDEEIVVEDIPVGVHWSSCQNLSAAATGCSNLDNLSLNKLSTNPEKLLIDSEYEYSDAEIVVEDIPVGVHQSILAARSKFFQRLFKRGNGGEVKEGKPRYLMSDLVPYGTVGYEAFNVFLSYLYTGKLKPSPPEVSTCVDGDCAHDACRPAINYAVELMYASATFQMQELVLFVQRCLLNFVDKAFVEDVIPILVAAFYCQLNQLLSHCIHRVERSDLDNISLEKELPYEVSKEIISLRLKSQQEAEPFVPEEVMDPLREKRIMRIHKALDSDDVELVKMLLSESNITLDQAYALHYAAAYCDPNIFKKVLNLDLADLNCRNGRGYTILHVAARRKEPSILMALLHKGASASERTVDGQTAVEICRRLTRPKDYNEKTNQGQESNKDKLCIDVLEREMRGSSISVNMAISSQVIADDLNMKLRYYENRGTKDAHEAPKSVLANTQSMAASQSHATRLPPNNPFEDVLSWPKMWAKLTANPATRTDLKNKDFVRIMHELHNIYLKDERVIQALGVLLNISFWMPTSADTEMPESLSLLSLPLEWKKGTEAKPAKELDLMELKAEEGMDKEPQAFKEQELDNAAYDKNDLDTVIAHYTKVMELGDGDISCLINRAIAYLAMGQYEKCINDCDKAVERGRQLKSDSKMIEITLTTKGIALVKMEKLSKDNVPTIESYQKALSKHRNLDTLKKLNDAKEVKKELEQQEYLDTKLADEEHEKEADKMTGSSEQKKFKIEEGMEVEEMQPLALRTLQPQGVVFKVEAVKIVKPSGQMEFQIEDVQMEPEASEQHRLFLMQGGLGLTKPPKDEDWKNAKEIYLMDNELSFLPENPECHNLLALFLPRNYKLRTIPPSFFINMPALQILNLSKTSIKSLPNSLFSLVGLKRLFLNDCRRLMMLSPKVGDLKLLEVLDLEGAKIMDLPMEIKELTNLTCLEVSFYGYMSNGRRATQSNAVVPCGVISALSQLEELNIDVNPDDQRWDACVEDVVTEVCTLKMLETLKFYFPRVELLRHFQWNSLKLSHFRFTVGRHAKRIMSRVPCDVEFELERWETCLKYINGVGVPGDIKKVLQHAVAFFLDRHATVKKLSDFGLRNMKQLKCCVMGECNEVQVIIDVADAYGEDGVREIVSKSNDADRIVMGSLEYLYIYYMKSLRSIWEGPVQQNSLFHLKSLTLRTCPQLTTIFTQGLLANLCNLEEIKVEDCPSIKSIVICEISAEHRSSYFLPNLKKISLHYMPGLISISSGLQIAPKLEWLSFYNCPNLKNPLIEEISSQDLKKIKGERSWWKALEWSSSCPSYLEEIFVPIDIQDC